MKQTASHSNTPEFGVNKSATGILRQEPTKEELKPVTWFSLLLSFFLKTMLPNMFSAVLILIAFCSMVFLLQSCADQQGQEVAFVYERGGVE